MGDNTDEHKKRQEDLNTARSWLGDAREWMKLAGRLNNECAVKENSFPVDDHKLNVAHACAAMTFQLAYKSLLAAAAKWPRKHDEIARTHKRLQQETQTRIEGWITEAGYDVSSLLKNLDKHMNEHGMENGIHQFDISTLANILGKLVKLAEQNLSDARNTISQDKPNPETALDIVLKKIGEIARASEDGDYIYRGEPECYDKVTSNLYRHYEGDIEAENFEVETAQAEMLKEAKGYAQKAPDFETLTQLQHYGGKTNLIDFTTDYLVALFFACNGSHDEDGRILLLKQTEESKSKYRVTTPRIPQNRVIAQKSKFVQPPEGFIYPSNEIDVPRGLKKPMLDYLRKHHAISTETIYNDLHGFIKHQELHDSAYAEFYKGETRYKRKEFDKAIEHYNTVLRLNPGRVEGYINRGNSYQAKGEYVRSIKDFDTAIQLKPDSADAYYNRGNVYRCKGEVDCAIRDFGSAIRINPNFAEACYNRGLAHYEKGEYHRAIEDYTNAITIKSDHAVAYNNRGLVYLTIGEVNSAIEDYTKAIEFKSDYVPAYCNRGLAYQIIDKINHAIEDYTKAIELNSDYAQAYCNRGSAYQIIGEVNRAIEDYTKAVELNSDYAQAYYNRGLAYYDKGDNERVIEDFSTAIELKSDYASAYYNRGLAYYDKGAYRCAIEDYSKAIELKRDWTKAHYNRAFASLHIENWAEAKSDLTIVKHSGVDIVATFRERDASIADFEQRSGVKLPKDIAAILQPS